MSVPRCLVVARVGDGSLHASWCAPRAARTFDVAFDYFGRAPGRYADECDFYTASDSTKWPALADWLDAHADVPERYDYVFFPDDDLVAEPTAVERLFAVAAHFGLWLAQPALTSGSHVSHPVTVQQPGSLLRFTNFVEVMAPVFSREALAVCAPTFRLSRSGWGLDYVWPVLLGQPQRSIAVVDAVGMCHARPVGGGSMYASTGVDPRDELAAVASRFHVPLPYEPVVYEQVPWAYPLTGYLGSQAGVAS